ncbi:RNA-binding protein 25, partial [Ophiophagus hannah]
MQDSGHFIIVQQGRWQYRIILHLDDDDDDDDVHSVVSNSWQFYGPVILRSSSVVPKVGSTTPWGEVGCLRGVLRGKGAGRGLLRGGRGALEVGPSQGTIQGWDSTSSLLFPVVWRTAHSSVPCPVSPYCACETSQHAQQLLTATAACWRSGASKARCHDKGDVGWWGGTTMAQPWLVFPGSQPQEEGKVMAEMGRLRTGASERETGEREQEKEREREKRKREREREKEREREREKRERGKRERKKRERERGKEREREREGEGKREGTDKKTKKKGGWKEGTERKIEEREGREGKREREKREREREKERKRE